MRTVTRHAMIWGSVVFALGLLACDDAETEASDGGVVVVEEQDMAEPEPLEAFCQAQAAAKCEWAFGCLQPAAIRSTFGLDGGSVEDCTTADTQACLDEVNARAERGTLDFSEDAVESCVNKLTGAPCLEGTPSDWVGQWYKRVASVCNTVVRGNVSFGDACTTRRDCSRADNLCAEDTCRDARPGDIMRPCGDDFMQQGSFAEDPSCPGEVCVGLGNNAQEIIGTCTADCRYGTGCPGGAYCLQQPGVGQPPAWYCTWPCRQNRDCQGGLVCTPINPDDADIKHCAVTAPE